jgi:hypothetical protein
MHQELDFHIEQKDYFGTVATVLDCIRQDLHRNGFNRHSETLSNLCDELMYLQRSHRIEESPVA